MSNHSLRPLTPWLDQYAKSPNARERRALERELFDRYGANRAVIVTDMAGFSRTVDQHGIVHYLAMIRRCQRDLVPALREYGGQVLRCEADNSYALFEDPRAALEAAVEAQRRIKASNAHAQEDLRVGIGMGIGYGTLLLRGKTDAFGHELNLASKLGEDLSNAGEILLSEAMCRKLRLKPPKVEARESDVSGLHLPYFAYLNR